MKAIAAPAVFMVAIVAAFPAITSAQSTATDNLPPGAVRAAASVHVEVTDDLPQGAVRAAAAVQVDVVESAPDMSDADLSVFDRDAQVPPTLINSLKNFEMRSQTGMEPGPHTPWSGFLHLVLDALLDPSITFASESVFAADDVRSTLLPGSSRNW